MSNAKKSIYRKPITNASQLVMWRDSFIDWFKNADAKLSHPHIAKSFANGKTIFVRKDILDLATSVDIDSITGEDIANCLPAKEGYLSLEGTPSWPLIDTKTGEVEEFGFQIAGIHWHYNENTTALHLSAFTPPKLQMHYSNTISRADKKLFLKTYGDAPMPSRTKVNILSKYRTFKGPHYLIEHVFSSIIALIGSEKLVKTETIDGGTVGVRRSKSHDKAVSVVSLRSMREVQSTSHNGGSLSVRFIVSGHFRNQWYAGEEVHKRIFIDPYIKGPEGAPLKLVRPVYLF